MMASKTLIAMALATIIAVSIITYILPAASAHGVQAQLQSRFVRIDNEQFSDQTLTTGEDLTVTGELTRLGQQAAKGVAIAVQRIVKRRQQMGVLGP